MAETILKSYLSTIDARWHAMVTALDAAVRAAAPELKPDIRYRIFMYGLHGDYRAWVCAISPTTKVVCLRFLWGNLLEDRRRLLRPGSSTLMTIDYKTIDDIDPVVVAEYVKEAVARYGDYKVASANNKP